MRIGMAVAFLLAGLAPAAAQSPYGYGLGTRGYGHGLNGGLSGRAAGPGEGPRPAGGDGIVRGGAAPGTQPPPSPPGPPRPPAR